MKRILVLISLIAVLTPSALFAQSGGPMAGVMTWLHDNMSMEMGSVSIDGLSYSKVTLSPEVRMGRLKLGLYLPVIYKDDLFNPSTWYAPGGNNEWNFGADYWGRDTFKALLDVAADLVLKVKYLEYGQPLEDKFFVKVGNLHDLTIGHGLIMRNYRNDSDFPSVRRTGVNTGIDFGGFGFEALANDLPVPDIVGARLYFRPIKGSKLAFGLSGVADLAAASDMTDPSFSTVMDNLMFLGTGLDLDFPIIKNNEILSLRAFADAAVTVPYIKGNTVTYNSVPITGGLRTDLIWNGGPKNWGAATGLLGNVLFIDWRLEYRYFTGIFRPAFFDSTYERARSVYVQQYLGYLDGTHSISTAPTVMGIYGEAGFSLLKDRLSFSAGYMWPWNPAVGFSLSATADDELHAGIAIKKGLIPVVDLAGAVYYDKWGLVNSIMDGSFQFFDEKTAFAGEVDFPIPGTPNLSVAAIFKAVAKRDASGSLVYVVATDPSKGIVMQPSITIETRFRF
ncbi:MAG: hypothetical protein NT061_02230 [Spirochaetes bacterium]|nr:hypothetical protein [Spirochaetota bacterium]